MSHHVTRRAFVAASSFSVMIPSAAAHAGSVLASGPDMLRAIDGGLPESFPTLDPQTAREVVLRAHTNYDGVKELVVPQPELAKIAWDWGFGDWESALGAASHMGRRDIAELLIDHGALPNLFTFAMLGQVDVVRAVCQANPGIQAMAGPHGLTLMQHARNGGEESADVVRYLSDLGDADDGPTSKALDEDAAKPYVGTYRPNDIDEETLFKIAFHQRSRVLTFARDERQLRFLHSHGDHVFAPSGAASVRIIFDVRDGRAVSLTIQYGDMRIAAQRI